MQFSLITICFNPGAALRTAAASVLAQSHPDIEYIVVDGASTDGTVSMIRDQGSGFREKGIAYTYVSEPDDGLYDALNKGFRLATGEVVGFVHADDFLAAPTVLADVAQAFEAHGLEACFGDLAYVRESADNRFRVVRHWQAWRGPHNVLDAAAVVRAFRRGWMPPHPTLFVKRELYEKLGGFRLDHGTAADYELMLRFLGKHRIRVGYLPQVLIAMRTGGASNVSVTARAKANKMDRQAWRTNKMTPLPWTHIMKPLRKLPQWLPLGGREWRVGRMVSPSRDQGREIRDGPKDNS